MKKIAMTVLTATVLLSCTGIEMPKTKREIIKQEFTMFNQNSLVDKEFIVETEAYKDMKITIGFSKDRVYGFGGVNRYFGFYKVVNNRLVIKNLGVTAMAGKKEHQIAELAFLTALENNKEIKLEGPYLILISNEDFNFKFKDVNYKEEITDIKKKWKGRWKLFWIYIWDNILMGLFDFLKNKKEEITIYSPVNGKVILLSEVPDEAFAQRMVGDGCAIEPEEGEICSPIEGTLMNIFPTNHAVIFESIHGLEMIVHFGIDTVKLEGKGFQKLREPGAIKIGEKIVNYNLSEIISSVPSVKTPVIINNMEKVQSIEVLNLNKTVKIGDPIMKVILK